MAEATQPILFAASDVTYFLEHGVPFARSVLSTGNKAKIIVFPNLELDHVTQTNLMVKATDEFVDNENIDIQYMDILQYGELASQYNIAEDRAFYASLRFILLQQFVSKGNYLTLDIDSIVQSKIMIAGDFDVCLFLREKENMGSNDWEREGMKVAAGILYTTPKSRHFIDVAVDELKNNPLQWFCDQRALHRAYIQTKDTLKIGNFNNSIMDWNIEKSVSEAPIITAKGARKTHPNYLALKSKYK